MVYLLSSVGVKPKNIKEMVVRWPQLLTLPVAQMLAVTDYLGSFNFEGTVGSLYRQHPWVLAAPVGTVRRAVEVLVDEIAVRRLENVVRAYPRALVKGRDDLQDIPPQLFFVHQGQTDIKELHWHQQLPGVLGSTAEDSFHLLKPANTGDGPAAD